MRDRILCAGRGAERQKASHINKAVDSEWTCAKGRGHDGHITPQRVKCFCSGGTEGRSIGGTSGSNFPESLFQRSWVFNDKIQHSCLRDKVQMWLLAPHSGPSTLAAQFWISRGYAQENHSSTSFFLDGHGTLHHPGLAGQHGERVLPTLIRFKFINQYRSAANGVLCLHSLPLLSAAARKSMAGNG